MLQAGGARDATAEGMASIGLIPTAEPVRGDVGEVQVWSRSGPVEIGAICTGSRWAAMSDRGLRILKASAVSVWRVPHAC